MWCSWRNWIRFTRGTRRTLPVVRNPRNRPESNHLLTVLGETLHIFATCPVVKSVNMASSPEGSILGDSAQDTSMPSDRQSETVWPPFGLLGRLYNAT